MEFNSILSPVMRTLNEIIEAAGGPGGIEARSGGAITRDAVYKWPTIGVPDRHWELLITHADSSAEELYQANRVARGARAEAREAAA